MAILLRLATMTVIGVALGMWARHERFADWPIVAALAVVMPWLAMEIVLRVWHRDNPYPPDACRFCGDPAHGSLIRTGRRGRRKGKPIRYCYRHVGAAIDMLGRR